MQLCLTALPVAGDFCYISAWHQSKLDQHASCGDHHWSVLHRFCSSQMNLVSKSEVEHTQLVYYPLSTSRNQVLVQSQCYCQFLVGSTGEPFKNRLLFHWLESQYRARTCVTEYVSCFVSLARQRQTQQTCSRCIAPRRSIGTQHTKAPLERSKSIKSRQLSSRSRSTPMPRTEQSTQCRSIPNKPKQTINNGGRCVVIDVHGFANLQRHPNTANPTCPCLAAISNMAVHSFCSSGCSR